MRMRMAVLSMFFAGVLRLHADSITVLGATEAGMPLSAKSPEARFAVKVEAGVGDMALPVIGATRDGQPVPIAVFRARIVSRPVPQLVITINRHLVREPGKYAVTMQAPASTAAANAQPTALAVTLVRPAAELRIRTPLRIKRSVGLCCAKLSAAAITIDEIGGRSGVTPLQKNTTFDLRTSDDVVTGHGTLTMNLLPVNGNMRVPLTINVPTISRASGVLAIRAPELANGRYEQTIEVISQLAWAWLIPTIILGLFAGNYFRHVLEKRALRLEALALASRQHAKLVNLIATTKGSNLVNQLQEVLDEFSDVLADLSSTPAAIGEAAKAAQERAEERVKSANERQGVVQATVDELRGKLGELEGLPKGVVVVVAELRRRLDEAAVHLRNGALAEAAAELNALDEDAARALRAPLREWSEPLKVVKLPSWPDINGFDALLTRFAAALNTIDESKDWAPQLEASRKAVATLREIILTLGENVPLLTEHIAAQLATKGATAADLAEIRAAGEAVRKAADDASATSPRELANLLVAASDAMDGAIRKLADAANAKDPAGLAGIGALTALTARTFEVAVRALPAPRTERALDRDKTTVQPVTPLDLRAAKPGAKPSSEPAVRVVAPDGHFRVQQAVTFMTSITNTKSTVAETNWVFDGEPSKSATWTPRRAGTQRVRVTARLDDGTSLTSERSVVVAPAIPTIDSKKLDQESANVRRLQTIGAGILLTGLGVLVFRPTFLGTFADFFAAFGWGFVTDVGFARVVEMFKTDRSAFPATPATPAAAGR